MGFFVIGINHKDCPVEVRERLHFTSQKLQDGLAYAKTTAQFSESMILSTCNRVEFYGYTDSESFPEDGFFALMKAVHGADRRDFEHYLYRHHGREALRHLFRVAAGLDSLVIGESEILGQLRNAFQTAHTTGCLHSLLYRLMEKALKLGKAARTETLINEGAVSIPSVAVELAEKIFGQLTSENVMVLGTGEMATLTVKNLKSAGASIRYVVSHDRERAEKLTVECGGEWVPFETWEEKIPAVDIFITATNCPYPIVKHEQIKKLMSERHHRPLFLIDIAVPRNVDPVINQLDDVYLYNIDDLKSVADRNLKHRGLEIAKAEAMVEKALVSYQSWLEQLEARPTVESFERHLDKILEEELGAFAKKSGVSDERRDELRNRIRAKLLHVPLTKIKEASQNGGVARYLHALHSLFDLGPKDKE
ncbi:MAG: glutamyl-tRNA reductase [Omnitrophica bacterium RIFOXYB12_FULL_50_7]|nr:MAG: glutamyl-tRNA reductase [Omnitrophica bacterium RIFOXYB12_FULL_50_7]